MKKVLLLVGLALTTIVVSIYFWPGNTVSFRGYSLVAPKGWTAIAFDEELWVKPREGLWGRGLVKVRVLPCSFPTVDELRTKLEEGRGKSFSDLVEKLINEKKWIFGSSVIQDPIIYSAQTKTPDGNCIRINGDPLEIVTVMAEQFSQNF